MRRRSGSCTGSVPSPFENRPQQGLLQHCWGRSWLLLKAAENLDEEKDEKKQLEEALALNKSLAVAYYLKEDLRRFWEQPGKRFATAFLDGWIRRAEASGIKMLQQMAKTLAAHRSGLLAYYDVMITSGPMEGTNNKIKTMKRQAYGFRDKEFFKLKILAIHETRYELTGHKIWICCWAARRKIRMNRKNRLAVAGNYLWSSIL